MINVHHIPICPFCQRLEILLELKERRDAVRFEVVDITRPREPHILALTSGSTALPVMEVEGHGALKESLVLMRFLEDRFPEPPVRREAPFERAVEELLLTLCDPFIGAGYRLVMNQDASRRDALIDGWNASLKALDEFLRERAVGEGPWLFERFGWAEVAFTPFFQRFAMLPYYEGVGVPDELTRVRAWWDACVAHPAVQQTSNEEVIKLYYDYARGKGNGALPEGRERSTFAFEPHWRDRPWPPQDKYAPGASDAALGLV